MIHDLNMMASMRYSVFTLHCFKIKNIFVFENCDNFTIRSVEVFKDEEGLRQQQKAPHVLSYDRVCKTLHSCRILSSTL